VRACQQLARSALGPDGAPMLSPRFDWLWGACSCNAFDSQAQADNQISLSADGSVNFQFGRTLPSQDVLDVTFPRDGGKSDGLGGAPLPYTPRLQNIRDALQLPKLQMYPVPPNCSSQDSEEEQKRKLLQMYQEVALDLHAGMYLTQLTADRDYSDIHCQLMEDMTTLKLDQSNGRIIEFPLTNVSKVYRIVKNDDKFYTPGANMSGDRMGNSEHIVVVEFLRRKLAFVYREVQVAQRFMICMELLIRRAQQKQALRSLTPTFPPRQYQDGLPDDGRRKASGTCPTPRLVYEAVSRPLPCEPKSDLSQVDRSL